MIHMGALIGNAVSQAQSKEFGFKISFMKHFRNDREKRDFITAGAGAGVAAAFGAPLGMRVLLIGSSYNNDYRWHSFLVGGSSIFLVYTSYLEDILCVHDCSVGNEDFAFYSTRVLV